MRYLAFDLETTGVSIYNDEPIQIGLGEVEVLDDGYKLHRFRQHYIASEVAMNVKALACHGIEPETYMKGLNPKVVVKKFDDLIEKQNIEGLITYNGFKFDIPMLQHFIKRHGGHTDLFSLKIEDPAIWYLSDRVFKIRRPETFNQYHAVASKWIPKGTKFKLHIVCEEYGIKLENAHSALGDVTATVELWKKMRDEPAKYLGGLWK